MRKLSLGLVLTCSVLTAMAQAPAASAGAAPAFAFGTASTRASPIGMWQRRLYEEALRRLGWRMTVVELPLPRIAQMLRQGEIDGDMTRAPVFGVEHPELVKVDMPLLSAVFSVYSLKPGRLSSVEDLRASDWTVAFHRGVVGCEKRLADSFPASLLTGVNKTAQGLGMLERQRVQAFCDVSNEIFNEPMAQAMIERGQLHKLFDVGAPVPLNAYLHARHAELAPKLAATLKQMKDEGLFDRYWTAGSRRPD